MRKKSTRVKAQESAPVPETFELGSKTAPRPGADWQLEAVRHVRILMGQGYRRIVAQQQIALALGRTLDDLQSWERELVKSSDIENDLLCSEFAGELLEFLSAGHYSNVPHYKSYGSYEGVYNVTRAAAIAKASHSHSLSEIRSRIRSR